MSGSAPALARRDLAAAWMAMTLAAGFWFWARQLQAPPADVGASAIRLVTAVVIAGVPAAAACLLLTATRYRDWLPRLGLAGTSAYLAAAAGVGAQFAPWLALPVAAGLALRLRATRPAWHDVLVLHAAGTLAGLYTVWNGPRIISAWPDFVRVLAGLRILVVGG